MSSMSSEKKEHSSSAAAFYTRCVVSCHPSSRHRATIEITLRKLRNCSVKDLRCQILRLAYRSQISDGDLCQSSVSSGSVTETGKRKRGSSDLLSVMSTARGLALQIINTDLYFRLLSKLAISSAKIISCDVSASTQISKVASHSSVNKSLPISFHLHSLIPARRIPRLIKFAKGRESLTVRESVKM